MVKKAVILAGGLGTRMLPYTKACAKEMLPLNNKPALHYIVEEAVNAGILDILIVISEGKEEIIKYFTYDNALDDQLEKEGKEYLLDDLYNLLDRVTINFVMQKEADGTGGAILLCEKFVNNEPFLVMNGDDVMTGNVSKQLVSIFNDIKKSVIGVQQVDEREILNCGSVKVVEKQDNILKISGIMEKPKEGMQYSMYATQGRYVLTPDIFDYIKKTQKVANEIRLTDSLNIQAQQEFLYAYNYKGVRYDMGSHEGYHKAFIHFDKIKNKF